MHDAKSEIMRDIDSFVASIRSVGEKNMDATASLETRCVKLEARMNENEHAANDETNVINQLKMNLANAERALAELRDDSERRFQEAEYAVDCLKEEVSDGFSARLVVCEARLYDDCPVGSRARRETALANLERKYATKAELEDLDLLVQKEHDKYKESLQANLKATEQARRAKEMDTAAMLSEHKSMLGKHAKMLENSQKKVEKIEKEKKTKEVEEAKKTDVFEKSMAVVVHDDDALDHGGGALPSVGGGDRPREPAGRRAGSCAATATTSASAAGAASSQNAGSARRAGASRNRQSATRGSLRPAS